MWVIPHERSLPCSSPLLLSCYQLHKPSGSSLMALSHFHTHIGEGPESSSWCPWLHVESQIIITVRHGENSSNRSQNVMAVGYISKYKSVCSGSPSSARKWSHETISSHTLHSFSQSIHMVGAVFLKLFFLNYDSPKETF